MHAEGLQPLTPALARTTVERAARDALYLTIGLGTSILALALWIAALSLSLSLALFVIGLPVMLCSAIAFRWATDLDRRNAALVLGRPLTGRYDDTVARVPRAAVRDAARPPDLAGPAVADRAHVVGLAFGAIAIGLIAQVLGNGDAAALVLGDPRRRAVGRLVGAVGDRQPVEALLVVPLAVPLAAIGLMLLRVMALGEARLAAALLGPPRVAAPWNDERRRPARRTRRASRATGCRCTSRSRRSPASPARWSGA